MRNNAMSIFKYPLTDIFSNALNANKNLNM